MHRELPARLDLDWYRKHAKDLVGAYRAGAPEAVERVEKRLGARARERFGLSDAQWLIAQEHGYRSWADFRGWIETRDPVSPPVLAAAFEAARARFDERDEAWLDSGLTYGGGEPLLVLVRKRPRGALGWFEFSDDARGATAAGKPRGWLTVARQVVDELGMNLNRRGVVFMAAPERRGAAWHHSISTRVADASLAVYEALLELDD